MRWPGVMHILGGVQPQSIEVKFGNPIARVADKELADLTRPRPVKIDGGSPVIFITIGEVAVAVSREVIPVWTEVVVDHVKDNAKPAPVSGIDETFAGLGVAVHMRRGIE